MMISTLGGLVSVGRSGDVYQNSGKAQMEIPLRSAGFLRGVLLSTKTTGGVSRYVRPRHAADRTRTRRALAGSRRARRYGVPPRGPSGHAPLDYPFNALTTVSGYDMYLYHRFAYLNQDAK